MRLRRRPRSVTEREWLDVTDTYGRRDDEWKAAIALARRAIRTFGWSCVTCGARHRVTRRVGALYCDERCRNRYYRRRALYRQELRRRRASCPYCGGQPG